MRAILLSGVIALLVSLLGTRVAITQFTRLGYGQEIRDDGPTSHHTKRGTPTMGGVAIVLAALLAYLGAKLAEGDAPSASGWLLVLLFVGCGLVGFLDDFIKVFMQRNLGLRSGAKMIGQTLVAVTFAVLATCFFADKRGVHPASHYLSTIHDWGWKLPLAVVIVVIWFIVTATSNAVNLTDGLDGLATGVSMMVFGAYTIVSIWQNNQRCGSARPNVDPLHCYTVRDPLDLAILSAAITGACFGFLWWNASPAKIFMGDTGSLALGGALAGLAIMSRTEMLMAVIGGIFVLETLSVILQVGFFKLTKRNGGAGKRLFRMTPIHHHFEMLGWEQITVVIRFWIIAGICVTAGLGVFYGAWVVVS